MTTAQAASAFLAALTMGTTIATATAAGPRAAAAPVTVPREPLQVREVLSSTVDSSGLVPALCHSLPPTYVPEATSPVTLRAGNPAHPACWHLGPSLLTIDQAAGIRAAVSGSGPTIVHDVVIELPREQLERFDAVARRVGRSMLALVILGQMVEVEVATLEVEPPTDGGIDLTNLTIAGTNPLAHELALALRTELVVVHTPTAPA
jgi:hypothetical protein